MEGFSLEAFDNLFAAIVKLNNIEDVRKFFLDVCTVKEMEAMSQRLKVAELLSSGKNYQEVSAQTGASTATISRVNKCLLYGGGGYAIVLSEGEND
jgi:TrpR-related protein YerC/YecD